VGQERDVALLAGHRGRVDDLPAPAGGDHVTRNHLGAVEDSLGVDVHVVVPVVLGEIDEPAHRADAGVVVPDVDRPKGRLDRVDHTGDRLAVRDVERPGGRPSAGLDDLARHRVRSRADVRDGHQRTLGRIRQGAGAADARAGPCDRDDLPHQPHHVTSSTAPVR